MTTFIKRSQTAMAAAQTKKVQKALVHAGVKPVDTHAVDTFARQCMLTDATKSLTVPQSAEVGVLTLALAGWVIDSARAMQKEALARAKTEEERVQVKMADPLIDILKNTLPLKPSHLEGALKDVIRLAPVYADFLRKHSLTTNANDGRQDKGVESSRTIFKESAYVTDWGHDGHPWSRETCARLRLTRFFEATSSDFAAFLSQAYAKLAKQGTAYLAWSANFPVLLCDLNLESHRKCAHLLTELCHGEAVMITAPLRAVTHGKLAAKMLVVEDPTGVFRTLAGNFAPAMLLERRLGGWTVTFPCGEVDVRELKAKQHPALARALAHCAKKPVYEPLVELKGDGKKPQHTAVSAADHGGNP